MATVEQQTKAAFARLFVRADWRLFKTMAEFYFERAACLRKSDMTHVPTEWRLLARNAQKRLFIGIGTELLLKALYLKHGFVINRLAARHPTLKFPFTPAQLGAVALASDETYMLGDLIHHLAKVPAIGAFGQFDGGLRIAKVFRNKEGHVVLPTHRFNPQDYRDIERALVELYTRGFGETLRVRFAVAQGERGSWDVR
jgi:hypothetical protein